jgi:hypothetical protein
VKDAQEGSADAAQVFRDIAVVRDKIPQDVLTNAVAIGVFKGVFNCPQPAADLCGSRATAYQAATGDSSDPGREGY